MPATNLGRQLAHQPDTDVGFLIWFDIIKVRHAVGEVMVGPESVKLFITIFQMQLESWLIVCYLWLQRAGNTSIDHVFFWPKWKQPISVS